MSLFFGNFVRLKILLYIYNKSNIYDILAQIFVNFRHIQGFSRDQIMVLNK